MKTSLPTTAGKKTANEKQFGGSHYKKFPLNHWDVVEIFDLGYLLGAATKYMFRWRDKGGIEDLKKARHYLDKKIEIEELRAKGLDVNAELLRAALAGLGSGT